MPFTGIYNCAATNATLIIKTADDKNGSGSGIFEIGNIKVPVQIHYHFHDTGANLITNLCFAGHTDDPNEYIGGAGATTTPGTNQEILIAGGYANIATVISIGGTYVLTA